VSRHGKEGWQAHKNRARSGSASVQTQEASELIKKTHHTKFNETWNSLSIWESIRSIRPGRSRNSGFAARFRQSVRVLVLAGGDKVREAQEAARISSVHEMVQKIVEAGRITMP